MIRVSDVYRREALEHREKYTHGGEVLRLTPGWGKHAYAIVLTMTILVVVFLAFAKCDEYARGTAMVRLVGRVEHTADERATVESVLVQPGQSVMKGEPLVALRSQNERADLDRMEQEFELLLARVLRDPSDTAASSSLSKLRAERDLARSRVEARVLRATTDGIVSDVRVRHGSKVEGGDVLASITGRDAYFEVVAALPGSSRPLVREGTRLRVEISGYPYAYLDLPVDTVSDDVVGPAEARRVLGPAMEGALALDGAVVLARARTAGPTFRANGSVLHFHDGMVGVADARLRRESLLLSLVPGLRYAREIRP